LRSGLAGELGLVCTGGDALNDCIPRCSR
jgi:hypothetical protein